MDVLIKVIAAYLLGSINGSLVVGRIYGGIDIRNEGSGNAGGTNALRTHGKLFALFVMIIDVGKSIIAASMLPGLDIPGFGSGLFWPETIAMMCAAAAVVGHVWPAWHGFRGGKGVATLIGGYLVLSLPAVAVMFVTWMLTLVLTGYVGLASIVAAASVPVYLLLTGGMQLHALFWFAVAMALLVVYTHRDNIARLRDGTEHRFDNARLFRRS